jgi:hypothetical protein
LLNRLPLRKGQQYRVVFAPGGRALAAVPSAGDNSQLIELKEAP